MRLGRSVLAGLVAGSVAGFLVALLRPRTTHPVVPGSGGFLPGGGVAPFTEPAGSGPATAHGLVTAHGEVELPSMPPVVAPGEDTWEPAAAVPGASRRIGSGDAARTQD